MSIRFANRAILVLESPWELDERDANRSSVIPFVEGVAKLTGDTDVHYANFYDLKSFDKALECLCKGNLESRIVYIAAHGEGKNIAGVPMLSLLLRIASRSRRHRIDGVLIGSCFVGQNSTTMEVCIEESRLRWCVGYTAATYWLDGTLIDCRLLAELSQLEDEDFEDRNSVVSAIARALSLFDPKAEIGNDKYMNSVNLRDGMSFVLQLRGRGQRARDVTNEVWKYIDDFSHES
ncbi:hypothetical protein [Marichromatium gracile]|uniref:Uncharacterized protein n=1 Tax=Marichromatium gracile TaxID=1048 RepID=A0A4V2W9D5_MARGR|nr:hypothetical protein [Marichromatium gracile]MBK1710240.1 hypothetical protein [Marichromatium gracile]TCW34950.1 hypothetical protein EDC29_108114 [Marichromatium gracile]